MPRPLAIFPMALCVACATTAPRPEPTSRPVATVPVATPPAPVRDARGMAGDARFADLVGAAQAEQAAGNESSSAGCLLERTASGYRLAADLAPALRSLPDAPDSLQAALATTPARTRVLTTYGVLGDAEGDGLTVAALSRAVPVPASEGAFVLALTSGGAALRHTARALGDLEAIDDAAALAALAHEGARSVYVTAEAAVPLSRVLAVLAGLPHDARPVLAVALPAGTRLPAAPPAPPSDTELRCPEGLPEPSADATEGELPVDALRAAVAPLSEHAASCFELTRGAAQAGGRMLLGLRIGPEGHVLHACLVEDTLGDAQLSACVVAYARGLQLPHPSPPGFVDVHLPLSLAPSSEAAQRGACAP